MYLRTETHLVSETLCSVKNAVFWDLAPCVYYKPTFRKNVKPPYSTVLTLFFARVISSTLKIEATHSFETSVYNKPARRQFPEDGILNQRRENLKSYIVFRSFL
jgi:hypothetical protein